jgi:hypothetical protein
VILLRFQKKGGSLTGNCKRSEHGRNDEEQQGRKIARTLQTKISEQRDKLKKLEEQFKDHQHREMEKNQKLVVEFIKAEKLDLISIDDWRKALPSILNALSPRIT